MIYERGTCKDIIGIIPDLTPFPKPLFTAAEMWINPDVVHQWPERDWYRYTAEQYLAAKQDKIWSSAAKRRGLEDIMLYQISQP